MLCQKPCDNVQKEPGKKCSQALTVNHLGNLIIGNQKGVIGSSQNAVKHKVNKNNQPVSPHVIRRNDVIPQNQIPCGGKWYRHQYDVE